jgi:hypothetical protein
MKLFILGIFLAISTPLAFSSTKWEYNKNDNYIYSIKTIKDVKGWKNYIILKITSNSIQFVSTVKRSEYNKTFTLNPPRFLRYKKEELIKFDSFFWGEKGEKVKVYVGFGDSLDFKLHNKGNEIIHNVSDYDEVIKRFKEEESVKLNKHYFKKGGEKAYPIFDLKGFKKAFKRLNKKIASKKERSFTTQSIYCNDLKNGKKEVWINESHGTYALNGPAIEKVNRANSLGSPLVGQDGKDWKMGRDYIPSQQLNNLIKIGIIKCK